MRVFQIGFSECGSSALAHLFQAGGVPALHADGRYWRLKGDPAVGDRNVQLVIHRNIEAGRPSLEGFERFRAFFGMEFAQNGWLIENFRHFALLAREYPEARFILNTGDKDDWLGARMRRDDGLYLAQAMERTGISRRGVLNLWADDFHRHHDMVRDHFRDAPERLIEFDIDRTPIKQLVRFMRPEMRIWPRHWRQVRGMEAKAAQAA